MNHRLQYHIFNEPQLPDFFDLGGIDGKTIHIRFGCDEPGEHDFSFTLDYQLPGGVRTSLTVDRLTTRVQLRAWDYENNRTTDDLVFPVTVIQLVSLWENAYTSRRTKEKQNWCRTMIRQASSSLKHSNTIIKPLRTISLVSGDKYSFEEIVSMWQLGNKAYTDSFTAVVKPDQHYYLWKKERYSGLYKRVNALWTTCFRDKLF